eukprot:m.16674 g.16674  ORF g.16674 m.16674 type:complete len:90 (+) comp27063_c0_seq1:78-347(+)
MTDYDAEILTMDLVPLLFHRLDATALRLFTSYRTKATLCQSATTQGACYRPRYAPSPGQRQTFWMGRGRVGLVGTRKSIKLPDSHILLY